MQRRPRHHAARTTLVAAFGLALLAGCVGVVGEYDDHAGPGWTVLAGEALAKELSISPIREAPRPFVRIGVMWEGALGSSVEVATSADGRTWSAWQKPEVTGVEAERSASFVGQVTVTSGEPALYYRIRTEQAKATPNFVQLNPLYYAKGLVESGDMPTAIDRASASPSFTVGTVRVNSRSSWGAADPNCVSGHAPSKITFHHTDTPTIDSLTPQARVRQIQNYHQSTKGWCDIGYHFLISRDGQVWEGRPATRLGSHTLNHNTSNIGVAFIGDFAAAAPNQMQMNVAAALVDGLHRQYGIALSSDAIKGHRDYVSTGCPGQGVYFNIFALIARASQGNFGGQPSVPNVPSNPGLQNDQTTTATVKGVIYENGNPARRLAGVTVTVAGRSGITDSNGVYTISNVAVGAHVINANHVSYTAGAVHRYVGAPVTWGSMGLTPVNGINTSPTPSDVRPDVERWRSLVEKYFRPQHVTWALHVMECESGGNPNARNPSSGAAGLFQHLPQYWADRAARSGFAGHSAFEGEANVAASAFLLYTQGGGPQHWVCRWSPFEDFSYRPGSGTTTPPPVQLPPPPPTQNNGCHVGNPFGYSFCSEACPCNIGQGDCDSDAQCMPGLVCAHDVGAKYGVDSTIDVCEPPSFNAPPPAAGTTNCHVGGLFGLNFCSATCPCGEGMGDCDSDNECMPGLICAQDVGASYGTDATVDVCQRPGGVLPTPPPSSGGSCEWKSGTHYRKCRDCGWQFCLKSGVWSSQCEAAPLVFGCSTGSSICGVDARCY